MRMRLLASLCFGLVWFCVSAHAAASPSVVVFWEEGFPSADTMALQRSELAGAVPTATFATAEELTAALANWQTTVLVLPFGSSFPEDRWMAIQTFLERGGNLVVIGGKPLTRPVRREGNLWTSRPETMAFAQRLLINDYQTTPGSNGLKFERNPDVASLELAPFAWSRGFSLILRLSDEDLYARDGSAGSLDARFTTLAWGVRDGHRVTAPVVQIDHLKNSFAGGRWVLIPCVLESGSASGGGVKQLIAAAVQQAAAGAEDFTVRPSWPLFLPNEAPTLNVHWKSYGEPPTSARLELEVSVEGATGPKQTVPLEVRQFPFSQQLTLTADNRKGLHVVTSRLFEGERLRDVYRTGYWLRDEAMLNFGPRSSVNGDFFEFDGKAQFVAGTTYMASDVQRQFFMEPNPYVWDRDMEEMQAAGMNMLRTGWWSGWDQVTRENGVVREDMLRALEAYLLTARKHGLPVQFTFFAFIPDVLGGSNPYLDLEAVRRQRELVLAVVQRFRDVPFLMWDLINEPSFSNPSRLWATRPNGDAWEQQAWTEWLLKRYQTREMVAEAWQATPASVDQQIPLPQEGEFSNRAAMRTMRGSNALKLYDYYLFSQEMFRQWAGGLKNAIRATGSQQLITVGQDEGGGVDRPSPAFFGDVLDFTTTHPWWLDDSVLWDVLVAKTPQKPVLVQEYGQQRQPQIDGRERRTPEDVAALLEKKLAIAASASAGAIQWLWHTNAYMKNDNEAVIGVLRVDGTEKPEAATLRDFGQFAAASRGWLSTPEPAKVAIVTSQALQYSASNGLAIEAQNKAVRTLEYYCRVGSRVVTENQLASLGTPKLAILPSPQALSDAGWALLLQYVEQGGTLLVTGSMERDPHWQVTTRLLALGLTARPVPMLYRQSELQLVGATIPLSFEADKQTYLEALDTSDRLSLHELEHGRGRVLVTNFPVELASGYNAVFALYRWALALSGVKSPFVGTLPSPGVLVRATHFRDALLYAFVSESGRDESLAFKDEETGASFNFVLPALRSKVVLMDRASKKVRARFGVQ